ncbi:host attachment family protein [Sandarakinorhabdus sp.]|jgi:protein required for attachment to host cells|uniref:host attachment family protein n=1 Tax=Sandarakinorhabdus sp. TaxID=1916663 RepID=UPI0028A667B6|nr:host attachment family protein [Sandarakinorhabdus sp.]
MDIPQNAHVLVMDGGKLLLFKNDGSEAQPALNIVMHLVQDSAATRDQGTERPGRAHESAGTRRSSHEQTDFHQLDEIRFAVEAAEMLKREVLAHHIDSFIVIAAPRTLGELRKHFHTEVERRVIGEISKDVARRPTDEIMAAIAAS